jgi:hypothetical protein
MQRAADAFASLLYSAWIRAGRPSIPVTTGIAGDSGEPGQSAPVATTYSLGQNYPNPFNPTTNFEFRIANRELVRLKIFDVLGREVATLVDDVRPAGVHSVRWDASVLPSGVYYYQLQSGDASASSAQGFVQTKKMILAK